MRQIKTEVLEWVKNAVLGSVIPSKDAQEIVRLLNSAEAIAPVEVKPDGSK